MGRHGHISLQALNSSMAHAMLDAQSIGGNFLLRHSFPQRAISNHMDRKVGQRTWPLFGHVLCPIYVSFHLECTPLFLLIDNLRFYRGGPGYRSTLVHFFVNAAPLRDQYDTFPAGYTWCNAFPALFSIVLHSGSHAYPLYMIYYGCYNGHNVWPLFGHIRAKKNEQRSSITKRRRSPHATAY